MPYRSFAYISAQCFHGISDGANDWVSVSISVSCTFPWALFFLFVLPYSNVLVFLLLHYYPLEACLPLNERHKRSGHGWEEEREMV